MIEIKAGELRGIYEVLNSLRSQLLPANQAYRIARIGRELDNEVNLYETQRAEIIKKYCDKDENGEPAVDENGNIIVDAVKPLENLGDYAHKDFDDIAHQLSDELNKGDDDDEMAYKFGY